MDHDILIVVITYVAILIASLIVPIWITVVILGRTKRTEAMVQQQGVIVGRIYAALKAKGTIQPELPEEKNWSQRRVCFYGHKIKDNEKWCAECGLRPFKNPTA